MESAQTFGLHGPRALTQHLSIVGLHLNKPPKKKYDAVLLKNWLAQSRMRS